MEKLKLCLIDDDKIFRFTTGKYLEYIPQAGEFLSFRLVDEAIDYLKENKSRPEALPDIILLDVNQSGPGGWYFMDQYAGFCNELALKPAIFLISSSEDENDRQRAARHPEVMDYLIKPFNENRLNEIINTSIKSQQ